MPGRACFMFFLADERLTVRRPFLYDPTVYNYLQKLSISQGSPDDVNIIVFLPQIFFSLLK